MNKEQELQADEYYKELVNNKTITTLNEALVFKLAYEKALTMHAVMPTLLLCIDAIVSWDITIGRKYTLIKESQNQYLIKNDKGFKDWIHKDWFEKSESKQ